MSRCIERLVRCCMGNFVRAEGFDGFGGHGTWVEFDGSAAGELGAFRLGMDRAIELVVRSAAVGEAADGLRWSDTTNSECSHAIALSIQETLGF